MVAGTPGNLQSQTLYYSLQLQDLMKIQIYFNSLKALKIFFGRILMLTVSIH